VESKRTNMRRKSSSPTNPTIPVTNHLENMDKKGGAKGVGVQLGHGNERKTRDTAPY